MPIRITNPETEQLIREMAELEQIADSQAVHKAVSQWLSEMNLTSREGKVVEEIVTLRVLIAYMDGEDDQSSRISGEVLSATFVLVLVLILGLVVSAIREGALLVAIGVSIASMYLYHRRLTRATRERSKHREGLNKQIAELHDGLPRELEFLSDGPTFVGWLCSSDESKSN
jgi:hypothetical protein